MNAHRPILGTLTAAAALLALMSAAPAGDLDPPSGPIGSTIKPLDQVEPRLCINDLPGSQEAVHLMTRLAPRLNRNRQRRRRLRSSP